MDSSMVKGDIGAKIGHLDIEEPSKKVSSMVKECTKTLSTNMMESF